MKLIVNADDFGYSRAINYGIIDSFNYGIVNSSTMIMNGKNVEHAIGLAKNNPTLGIGIHLNLTLGKPLRNDVPTLINNEGNFKNKKQVFSFMGLSKDEIYKEWGTQINRFLSYGLIPTHLDSHHSVHGIPQIIPIISELAKNYDLPVRNKFGNSKPKNIITTDIYINDFHKEGVKIDTLLNLDIHKGKTVELLCHPGYIDNEILNVSSYNIMRTKEVEILTSEVVKQWIKEQGIELINYNDLKK